MNWSRCYLPEGAKCRSIIGCSIFSNVFEAVLDFHYIILDVYAPKDFQKQIIQRYVSKTIELKITERNEGRAKKEHFVLSHFQSFFFVSLVQGKNSDRACTQK